MVKMPMAFCAIFVDPDLARRFPAKDDHPRLGRKLIDSIVFVLIRVNLWFQFLNCDFCLFGSVFLFRVIRVFRGRFFRHKNTNLEHQNRDLEHQNRNLEHQNPNLAHRFYNYDLC
jgi:hypothetical protein